MSLLGKDTPRSFISTAESPHARRILGVGAVVAAAYLGQILAYTGASKPRAVQWAATCIKPIPCLALAAAASRSSREAPLRVHAIAAGLVLGAIGDFLLSYPAADLFMPGLIAFAGGHVAYIVALSHNAPLHLDRLIPWAAMAAAICVALLPAVHAKHPSMLTPVLAYLVIETAVGWRASCLLNEAGRMRVHGAWLAVVAACVFMVSDGMLALNRFVAPVPRIETFIMVTYWAAQALFALSLWTL